MNTFRVGRFVEVQSVHSTLLDAKAKHSKRNHYVNVMLD